MTGTLYLVPTPIGNPDDITLRAIEVLRSVAVVAAEDTRNAMTMLRRLGLHKTVWSCFDHNERGRAPQILERLRGGDSVAVISDAGTPLLNDPGYLVVREALEGGARVVALPGPSAIPTALLASGLPSASFLFAGFLPRVAGAREEAARALAREPHTLVLFESPHRIDESLAALQTVLGDRRAALCFELTKERERIYRGTISTIRGEIAAADDASRMGEITLVIEGAAAAAEDWTLPERLMRALLARGLEARAVRDVVAETFELPRRAVYQRVLAFAREAGGGDDGGAGEID